ncbi:universal stress protein [Streptomyces sp. NPDC021093]|uniref:universal stress protein n=1 Tax=Streptomyces sp. NPDC021093 TaxID=3365112 RepID=UPI0037892891
MGHKGSYQAGRGWHRPRRGFTRSACTSVGQESAPLAPRGSSAGWEATTAASGTPGSWPRSWQHRQRHQPGPRPDDVAGPAQRTAPSSRRNDNIAVRREIVEGPARSALLNASLTADLLVVGARRRKGHPGMQLGPVDHGVLHHAACPVALVPGGEQPQDERQGAHDAPYRPVLLGLDPERPCDELLEYAFDAAGDPPDVPPRGALLGASPGALRGHGGPGAGGDAQALGGARFLGAQVPRHPGRAAGGPRPGRTPPAGGVARNVP